MSEKFPVEVKQFAEILGMEDSTAYGFLRLLADANIVETGKRPQPPGKKGKPATLYMLDARVGERLADYLTKKLQKLNIAPVILAAEAANDDAKVEAKSDDRTEVTAEQVCEKKDDPGDPDAAA